MGLELFREHADWIPSEHGGQALPDPTNPAHVKYFLLTQDLTALEGVITGNFGMDYNVINSIDFDRDHYTIQNYNFPIKSSRHGVATYAGDLPTIINSGGTYHINYCPIRFQDQDYDDAVMFLVFGEPSYAIVNPTGLDLPDPGFDPTDNVDVMFAYNEGVGGYFTLYLNSKVTNLWLTYLFTTGVLTSDFYVVRDAFVLSGSEYAWNGPFDLEAAPAKVFLDVAGLKTPTKLLDDKGRHINVSFAGTPNIANFNMSGADKIKGNVFEYISQPVPTLSFVSTGVYHLSFCPIRCGTDIYGTVAYSDVTGHPPVMFTSDMIRDNLPLELGVGVTGGTIDIDDDIAIVLADTGSKITFLIPSAKVDTLIGSLPPGTIQGYVRKAFGKPEDPEGDFQWIYTWNDGSLEFTNLMVPVVYLNADNYKSISFTGIDAGVRLLDSFSGIASYGVMWHYTVLKEDNVRIATVSACGSSAGIIHNDTYVHGVTLEHGDTSGVSFDVASSDGDIELSISVPNDGWNVRLTRILI